MTNIRPSARNSHTYINVDRTARALCVAVVLVAAGTTIVSNSWPGRAGVGEPSAAPANATTLPASPTEPESTASWSPASMMSMSPTSAATSSGEQSRAPDPGSEPRVGPLRGGGDVADAVAPPDTVTDQRTGAWLLPHYQAAGRLMFFAGLAGLVVSICGLVAVGIRRRRW